jgi:methylenetetrahydrofolate dehydrogenase (NADP+)/methenyltetrahydrofolate cyclohydrolase
MPARILDGKALGEVIRGEMKGEIEELKRKHGIVPGLVVILVGENPASKVYVKNKEKTALELGFHSIVERVPVTITERDLLEMIERYNRDETIHGILVQLPLPAHIDGEKVMHLIDPDKDVDGFHPTNLGRLMVGDTPYPPCTPAGIMELMKRDGTVLKGAEAVVVGRSNIVGKPMSMLLLHEHATVTVCHSRTRDLKEVTSRADVLVVAIGKPEFVTKDMVKPGAVVIDVGINRLESGKLVGDVEFAGVSEVASAITPVPGGVGPLTITMLMRNTVKAAYLHAEKKVAAKA